MSNPSLKFRCTYRGVAHYTVTLGGRGGREVSVSSRYLSDSPTPTEDDLAQVGAVWVRCTASVSPEEQAIILSLFPGYVWGEYAARPDREFYFRAPGARKVKYGGKIAARAWIEGRNEAFRAAGLSEIPVDTKDD